MTYVLIVNSVIMAEGLPRSARRLDTGEWVLGLSTATTELQQACGYYVIVEVPRPADTLTDSFDRTLSLINGAPTEVWVQRPKTQSELDSLTLLSNESSIDTYLAGALVTIDEVVNTAALSLTQADLRNLQGQVKDLARIERRLIKKVLRLLDTAN